MQDFTYSFNINGNYSQVINQISSSTKNFNQQVSGACEWCDKWANRLAHMNLATDYIQQISDVFNNFAASNVSLNSKMHELSAVAGVTGETLKQIEGFARESAKAFGTDASVAVEGYKLLLSQLSPELGKYPEVLRSMGDNIQTTAKLMGGDGVAAAQVLTTAMNQYGVSLEDPVAASQEMARMMNVMAAAGQAGSAELPAISAALQQCGMAAKAAGVSFEETNAAIQVLDKAGKKASEGGVALRNVLGQLSKGRFVDKQSAEELAKAGINLKKLGDNSLSLKQRLDLLKPMLNDSALLSKFFGVENANAARALIAGTDALQGFTVAVTGTQSAEEQAAIIMDSISERQSRFMQLVEDIKISISQCTGDMAVWIGTIGDFVNPFSKLIPVVAGVYKGLKLVMSLAYAKYIGSVARMARSAAISLALMSDTTALANGLSLGFTGNLGRMTIMLLRFATVGLWSGIKALGAYALSLITTGSASATFAGIASTSFAAFKLSAVTACRAVSAAIFSIPIVGWVALAVAALAALGVYFWNTSVKFRAVLKGLWAAFKVVFTGIKDMACQYFGAIGDLIQAAFTLDAAGIGAALKKLGGSFANYGKQIGKAFKGAYDAELKAGDKATKKGNDTTALAVPMATDVTSGSLSTPILSSDSSTTDGGSKIKNITINIDRLVDSFTISTQNLTESSERVKEAVLDALMGALNDTQLATA